MDFTRNTVSITGGASGIRLALGERFLQAVRSSCAVTEGRTCAKSKPGSQCPCEHALRKISLAKFPSVI